MKVSWLALRRCTKFITKDYNIYHCNCTFSLLGSSWLQSYSRVPLYSGTCSLSSSGGRTLRKVFGHEIGLFRACKVETHSDQVQEALDRRSEEVSCCCKDTLATWTGSIQY